MAPIIDIIRHAQALHNLQGGHIKDPELTSRGLIECQQLRADYQFGPKVTHILSSPLKRATTTALVGILPTVDPRIKVQLLPELQEVNASLSSTGIPKSELAVHYTRDKNRLDMSLLDEDWYRKGSNTFFAPVVSKVYARARAARMCLWRLARYAMEAGDDDAHIVAVTHGEFAHWLTGDFRGVSMSRNTDWRNAELRSYRFQNIIAAEPHDPQLVETMDSAAKRGGFAVHSLMNMGTMQVFRRIAEERVMAYHQILKTQEVPEKIPPSHKSPGGLDGLDKFEEVHRSDGSDEWVDVEDESDF
ncbi:histidine phosphatase superfamily [Daldinia caldariorum]|uniref:histidine phosphatase superfamily n=1 Tax=Daldinia caldariorum TaxID=326644 RepID=UPI0020075340|nr:histidine phosphatase superfamily [Daldinia caldariorum]KAI1472053.1 histidine phosphatase superfamily [Daldinia caldariorum]